MKQATSGLVYSTESGRMCPACRQPIASCACKAAPLPAGDGIARASRQTKGRGGKSVTVVKGLALDAVALAALGERRRAGGG
jgi:translation initiation factor 1